MNLSEKAPPILRQISVRAVMEVLLYQGPRSRAELAKDTKLSKQTMSEVIKAAREEGWVRENGTTSGHVGRTAILYEVDPAAGYVLGMDIGATTFRFAIRDITGEIRGESEHAALAASGSDLMDGIASMAEALIETSGLPRNRLQFCAFAAPGPVDPNSGRLTMCSNLTAGINHDPARELESRLACDVRVENDVNAAVVGECWLGEAKTAHTTAYIAIGSGVGVGVAIDGEQLRGATGAAGEAGYLPIGAPAKDRKTLERGALERAIGLKGLIEHYKSAGGDHGVTTAQDLLRALAVGDAAAQSTNGKIGAIGAQLTLAVQAMFDPSIIVLGGVLGQQAIVHDAIAKTLPEFTNRKINLALGTLGNRATLVGATAIALRRLQAALFEPDLPRMRRQLPPLPASN